MRYLKRTFLLLTLLLNVLVALPAVFSSQEPAKYLLKLKAPQAKQPVEVTSTGKKSISFKVVDGNQNVAVDKAEEKTTRVVYREIGLEKPAGSGRFTKLERQYSTAERRVDGKRVTLPYQGKTLRITKEKHGSYEFRLDDGDKLTIDQSLELIEEFNKGGLQPLLDGLLARPAPVAVGETWKEDPAKLADGFEKNANLTIDPAKSTIAGKLVRVYSKDSRQFAVIDLTIDLAVTALNQDGQKLPAKDSFFKLQLECDLCIDGSLEHSTIKGTILVDVRATVEQNGMQLALTIGAQGELNHSRREVAKK
jgi:hypothetical protein